MFEGAIELGDPPLATVPADPMCVKNVVTHIIAVPNRKGFILRAEPGCGFLKLGPLLICFRPKGRNDQEHPPPVRTGRCELGETPDPLPPVRVEPLFRCARGVVLLSGI